jgi:hypothetical protein
MEFNKTTPYPEEVELAFKLYGQQIEEGNVYGRVAQEIISCPGDHHRFQEEARRTCVRRNRMSSVLSDLGNLHIVYGTIIYTSGVPALASNDGSATVADTTTGVATVTFGQAFLSAPAVVPAPLKATEAATFNNSVVLDSVSTTTAVFRFKIDNAGTNSTADPADTDGCTFIAVGLRNN